METPKPKSSKKVLLPVIVVLTLIIGGGLTFASYRLFQNKSKQQVVKTPLETKVEKEQESFKEEFVKPAGFVEYENKELGFKFAYPQDWGTPKLTTKDGVKGKSYSVTFYPGPKYVAPGQRQTVPSRNIIIVSFDTDDYLTMIKGKDGKEIERGPYASKARITEILANPDIIEKSSNQRFAGRNPVSFEKVTTNPAPGYDSLEADRIVSLSKVKVSGAYATYHVATEKKDGCVQLALSPNDKKWCVNQSIRDTMHTVLLSFQAI